MPDLVQPQPERAGAVARANGDPVSNNPFAATDASGSVSGATFPEWGSDYVAWHLGWTSQDAKRPDAMPSEATEAVPARPDVGRRTARNAIVRPMNWQPISTFPGEAASYTFNWVEEQRHIRHFDEVLVYGPTWNGRPHEGVPTHDGKHWTGDPGIYVASTHEGKGYFTASPSFQDFETHVLPTHWMRLERP